MSVEPKGEWIVIRPTDETETETDAGVVLPEPKRKDDARRGEVVAAGPGKVSRTGARLPMEVEAGDAVLFSGWRGQDKTVDGERLFFIKQRNVLARV